MPRPYKGLCIEPLSRQVMDAIIESNKQRLVQLLESPKVRIDRDLRTMLQKSGGIYRVFNNGADWEHSIYIGKTKNLKQRIYGDHLTGDRIASTLRNKLIEKGNCVDEGAVTKYLIDNCSLQFMVIEDATERSFLEHFAIAVLRPIYND